MAGPFALILREKEEEVVVVAAAAAAAEAAAGREEAGDVAEAKAKTFRGIYLFHPANSHFQTTFPRRFTWGNPEIVAAEKRAKDDEKGAAPVEAKPVFELSGALARDTNKVNVGGGQIVVMK